MQQDEDLIQKRNELKQKITAGMKKLLMGLIFDYASRVIQKLTRRASPPSIYYTVIFVAVVIQLVGLLLALILNETLQYTKYFIIVFLGLESAVVINMAAKMSIIYVLQNIRDHIVDAIESVDNLNDLLHGLSNFWAVRKQVFFSLVFGIIVDALAVVILRQVTGEFVGFSITIAALLGWTIIGVSIYHVLQMLLLPSRLTPYQYNLFEASPIHSDVLRHLSLTLKNYTSVLTVLIAFSTLLWSVDSSATALSLIVLMIGWIPLTIQFLSNRAAINKIARNAKWKTLKAIEVQVKTIQKAANLADKETMECITRLLDYHDRIAATHDAKLEFRARVSFLNQILLTLLAYLLANFDSILSLFGLELRR